MICLIGDLHFGIRETTQHALGIYDQRDFNKIHDTTAGWVLVSEHLSMQSMANALAAFMLTDVDQRIKRLKASRKVIAETKDRIILEHSGQLSLDLDI